MSGEISSDKVYKCKMIFIGRLRHRGETKTSMYWFVLEHENPATNFDVIENNGEYINARACDNRIWAYDKIKLHVVSPGNIYEFETNPEKPSSIYTNTCRFVDRWKNSQNLAEWEIEHKTTSRQLEAEKMEKKMGNQSAFREAMQPLKEIYGKLNFQQQTAFMYLIHEELRRQSR